MNIKNNLNKRILIMKERNDEDTLKIITAFFVALQNQINYLDKGYYRQETKKYYNNLKVHLDKFIKERFKNLHENQIAIYDECSNEIADIIQLAIDVELPLANALLSSAKSGELISVDEKNEAVKNQLLYLQNFNQLKK